VIYQEYDTTAASVMNSPNIKATVNDRSDDIPFNGMTELHPTSKK
jgi:hypothetical protein